MTSVTFSWCPATDNIWRTGLASKEACKAAAKAEGIGEIFVQKVTRADPRWVIPTGEAIIEKMLQTCEHALPDAIERGWLKNLPNRVIEDLSRCQEKMILDWLEWHGIAPDWPVIWETEAVVID